MRVQATTKKTRQQKLKRAPVTRAINRKKLLQHQLKIIRERMISMTVQVQKEVALTTKAALTVQKQN